MKSPQSRILLFACVAAVVLVTMSCGAQGTATSRAQENNPQQTAPQQATQPPAEAATQPAAEAATQPAAEVGTGGKNVSQGDLVFVPGVDYVDYTNFLHIVGIVENHSNTTINYIEVEVKLYDKDGNEMAVTDTTGAGGQFLSADNLQIPAGGIALVSLVRDLEGVAGQYGRYEVVNLKAFSSDDTSLGEISQLEVTKDEETSLNSHSWYNVRGVFTNKGSGICYDPKPVVAGYDANGKLVLIEAGYLGSLDETIDQLAPGESKPFDFQVSDPQVGEDTYLQIARIEVVASCGSVFR